MKDKTKITAVDIEVKGKVFDFGAEKTKRTTVKTTLRKLISTGNLENINKALDLLPNKNISLSILEYLYNEAVEFFDAGKTEQAKVIFLKIAHLERSNEVIKNSDEILNEVLDEVFNAEEIEKLNSTTIREHLNEKIEYYIKNSTLNLGIIYTMENNPELGNKYRYITPFKKMFGVEYDIGFLLTTYNNYQQFKNEFQALTINFIAQERKDLMKYFYAIRKDIMKELRENHINIKSFTGTHLVQIKKIIGKEKSSDKELLAKIEKLAFKFKGILTSVDAVLLGDDLLEINFLEQLQFNKIDLKKNQDYYIEQLYPYIEQKISDVRKIGTYKTFMDDLKTRTDVYTKQGSDLAILYVFLMNRLAFRASLISAAIVKLMESSNSNISFSENIKNKIEQVLSF